MAGWLERVIQVVAVALDGTFSASLPVGEGKSTLSLPLIWLKPPSTSRASSGSFSDADWASFDTSGR